MHPPMQRDHPDCQHVIHALTSCHSLHPYAKFRGACNDEKLDLDLCFRAEKDRRRRSNLERARESDRRWEEARAGKP
ncbi:hypothetical protein TeGR_g8990 [Tetraparma gracilis]|uniref:COX assembly mitochondrial protein n=1 Tax=Tetraparma gracilis TaxID=2962635 RepID=A0ABQ6M5Z7_9STRA|nr:hypothetical protein TeGR_g8990 [Tetraparma gracilis]